MTEGRFKDWLETQPIDDKIVYLRYKYDHEDTWTFSKEILEVDMYAEGHYIWANDWYEGQQEVEILGCISINDVNVPLFTPSDTPQTGTSKTIPLNEWLSFKEYVLEMDGKGKPRIFRITPMSEYKLQNQELHSDCGWK